MICSYLKFVITIDDSTMVLICDVVISVVSCLSTLKSFYNVVIL